MGGFQAMDITEKIGRIFGFSGEEEEKKIDKSDNENPQDSASEQKEKPAQDFSGQNILSFNSAASSKESSSTRIEKQLVQSKITTIKPKDFNDAQIVANCLRDNIPVIINFEETDSNEATRIIDFISGIIYAIDGKIKQVGQRVFVCSPKNVTVSSSEEDRKPGMTFID
jgi:cell division inhibitor SepF